MRDVAVRDVQAAIDAIYGKFSDSLGHDTYMHLKVSASAIFAHALRLGYHPGPNPEDGTSVAAMDTTAIARMAPTCLRRFSNS